MCMYKRAQYHFIYVPQCKASTKLEANIIFP